MINAVLTVKFRKGKIPTVPRSSPGGAWLFRWRGSRGARGLFFATAAFAFVTAILPHPPDVPGNPSDKLQHITAFAVLALLGSFAYPRASVWRLVVGLSLFGAIIELVQAIPMLHRDSDVMDWLADTAAVLAVMLVLAIVRRRR